MARGSVFHELTQEEIQLLIEAEDNEFDCEHGFEGIYPKCGSTLTSLNQMD